MANKVKEAKIKKGKQFTDADFTRITDLVNKTIAQHQKKYYEDE